MRCIFVPVKLLLIIAIMQSNQLDYLRNIFIFIFFIWQFFISFKTIQVCLIMITMRKDETIKNKVNHFILYPINEYYLLSINPIVTILKM